MQCCEFETSENQHILTENEWKLEFVWNHKILKMLITTRVNAVS